MNKKSLSSAFLSLLLLFMLLLALCLAVPANVAPIWNIQTVDTRADSVGGSIALDSKNHPHISYGAYLSFTQRYGDIYSMYASLNGTEWNIETIDLTAGGGSLAFDSQDNPHISYSNDSGLFYASWTGSKWGVQIIDSELSKSSLVLDIANYPHVCYSKKNHLMYAKWTGTDWNIQVVDPNALISSFGKGSLALDNKGNPHISYYDSTNAQGYNKGDIKYAYWTGSEWSTQTVIRSIISDPSLAIDSKGHPHIVYGENSLFYTRWGGTTWETEIIDANIADEGGNIALDSSDKPHICFYRDPYVADWRYHSNESGLMYAAWTGFTWSIQTIDREGRSASIAIDATDNPHISYARIDSGQVLNFYGDLMYATATGTTQQPLPTPVFPLLLVVTAVIIGAAVTAVYVWKKKTRSLSK